MANRWYIIGKMNEEFDFELTKMIDAVCVGVEVPTDEEAEEAKDAQQGDSIIL
mgnify:CR=1 FL=1